MIITLVNVLGTVVAILLMAALALGGFLTELHERLPMSRPLYPPGAASIVSGLAGRAPREDAVTTP